MGMGMWQNGLTLNSEVFWMLQELLTVTVSLWDWYFFTFTSFCTLWTDNIEAHIESAKDNVVKAGGELEQAEHHQVRLLQDKH